MRILYIGPKIGNAYLQYKALKDIYKKVDIIDTYNSIFKINFFLKFFVHISPFVFERYFKNFILRKIKKNMT